MYTFSLLYGLSLSLRTERGGGMAEQRGVLLSHHTGRAVSGSCVPSGPVSPLGSLFLAPANGAEEQVRVQPFHFFLYIMVPYQQYFINHMVASQGIVKLGVIHLEHV